VPGPEFFQTIGGQRFIAQVTQHLSDQAEATKRIAESINPEATEQFMAHVRHHLAKQDEQTSRIADALERIARGIEEGNRLR